MALTFNEMNTRYMSIYEYLDGYFTENGVAISKDELLLAIDNSWRAIVRYLWLDYNTDIDDYITPLIMLSKAYYQNSLILNNTVSGKKQLKQMTEGSRSVTYSSATVDLDNDGLTSSVKAALPQRHLRMV